MKITSINLSKINKAVTGITETVRRSKVIIDGISEKVNKSNENIKNRISDATKLFQMRRQAARRKEREKRRTQGRETKASRKRSTKNQSKGREKRSKPQNQTI